MKTEKRLKEIMSEVVQDAMHESSISQKKRDNNEDVTNFNNVLNRKNKKLNESNINRIELKSNTKFRRTFKSCACRLNLLDSNHEPYQSPVIDGRGRTSPDLVTYHALVRFMPSR